MAPTRGSPTHWRDAMNALREVNHKHGYAPESVQQFFRRRQNSLKQKHFARLREQVRSYEVNISDDDFGCMYHVQPAMREPLHPPCVRDTHSARATPSNLVSHGVYGPSHASVPSAAEPIDAPIPVADAEMEPIEIHREHREFKPYDVSGLVGCRVGVDDGSFAQIISGEISPDEGP